MGLIAKSYDLSKVVLVVGGVPITGYGEEGGVEIEPLAPVFNVTVGADGLTVASKSNNSDGIARITVSEMSRGYLALGAQMKIQELQPLPVLLPLPFLLVDPSNGDTISSAFTIFTTRPNLSKQRVAGDRVFEVHLPGAYVTAVYGPLNIV